MENRSKEDLAVDLAVDLAGIQQDPAAGLARRADRETDAAFAERHREIVEEQAALEAEREAKIERDRQPPQPVAQHPASVAKSDGRSPPGELDDPRRHLTREHIQAVEQANCGSWRHQIAKDAWHRDLGRIVGELDLTPVQVVALLDRWLAEWSALDQQARARCFNKGDPMPTRDAIFGWKGDMWRAKALQARRSDRAQLSPEIFQAVYEAGALWVSELDTQRRNNTPSWVDELAEAVVRLKLEPADVLTVLRAWDAEAKRIGVREAETMPARGGPMPPRRGVWWEPWWPWLRDQLRPKPKASPGRETASPWLRDPCENLTPRRMPVVLPC